MSLGWPLKDKIRKIEVKMSLGYHFLEKTSQNTGIRPTDQPSGPEGEQSPI
jgi:hypothetical protein